MRHFEPGYYSNKRKFKHEFKLLLTFVDKTFWQSIKNLFVSSDKLSATQPTKVLTEGGDLRKAQVDVPLSE
jgi:hypothetical protein